MPAGHHVVSTPRIGGKLTVVLFIVTLFSFVVESEFTQYVQTDLGYRQPFLIFYVVHSSFALIFPLHLLYLRVTTNHSTKSLLNGLSAAVSNHLSPPPCHPSAAGFPRFRFVSLILALTIGMTFPGLLWFAAITLASVSDVTAIWNTNAFFAYIISVRVFHLKWESRRLLAVVLATLGVLVVVYGGSTSTPEETGSEIIRDFERPTAPLIGDLLTLMASLIYALYQVMYKKYAALPSDPELISERRYEPLPEADDMDIENSSDTDTKDPDAAYPPPFGFHPNFLTSAIGVCTFLFLWVPIPILDHFQIEPFTFPGSWRTIVAIMTIAISGVMFNAGFMILLGVWGPIMTSVGGLLTIALVFISDVMFGAGTRAVTMGSIAGSTIIVAAFGILAYDIAKH
ncbi:uncharacterized protein BT62DRAFT_991448 [Guyanagaster necrorhizus]|uniref:EamA domain-containing protein n=1 Tax=Guyanagaster necrorhizus TaxID=856835 RepID=A0A9P7W214_9AGAR|nr:uncharacterized protein BT62DRAFT_991448 [Guyanagaster necrorhizus MCA 3950]KAG7450539.1 hypothetical protein BT62DRAFT_991448 [Guyanagaster necrorhizus MCA 3950]